MRIKTLTHLLILLFNIAEGVWVTEATDINIYYPLFSCLQWYTASCSYVYLYAEAELCIYCIVLNRVFANNSGNPEPISTKFYSMMETHLECFTGNFGWTRSRAAKMTQKLTFCQVENASEMPFLGGWFAWNLGTILESMWSTIFCEKNHHHLIR